MTHERGSEAANHQIDEASAIAMDRYELSQPKALALLVRLARHHRVELRVVAAAIIAAAVARRRAAEKSASVNLTPGRGKP